jgi:hypothetical protein
LPLCFFVAALLLEQAVAVRRPSRPSRAPEKPTPWDSTRSPLTVPWDYIDTSGRMAIEPRFDLAQ